MWIRKYLTVPQIRILGVGAGDGGTSSAGAQSRAPPLGYARVNPSPTLAVGRNGGQGEFINICLIVCMHVYVYIYIYVYV